MKDNMDFKGNTTLMTVILVFLVLVLLTTSSVAAQPITVDGNGSDWDPSWFLAADPIPDISPKTGDVVYCGDAGYNLTGGWQHYNATEDKLYFMYNVTGIAGDVDGNDNPNNGSGDEYGVGPSEYYAVLINTSPRGDPRNSSDVVIHFFSNLIIITGPKAHLVDSVEAAIKTTEVFTPFVEFSVGNVTGWMANPYKYSLCGWASAHWDGYTEDWLGDVLYVTFPPVANFTFVAGDCNQTVWFNSSGSYDDPYGGIVNYTWNFSDGTPVEVKLSNSSFSHTFPVTNGTYNVSLTVIDTDNLTDTFVNNVPVNREPSITSVTANKTSVAEPGEWVLFEGWYSDPDGDTLTYRWVVDGVEIASGSSTNYYSNASYFVNRTLTANLTISDPNDCTNSSSVDVTYLYRPVPVINFTATGCLKVELNASESYDPDGDIIDYLWYVENGTIYNSTNVTCNATFSAGGNYTVRLNVTDNNGLTNTTTREICVSCVPEAVAEVNRTNVTEPGGWVLFDGSNSTCDTTCNNSNSLSYRWNITDGSGYVVNYSASVPYYITSNTTASLKVTDKYDCTNTSSVSVTYLHLPVPVINFTATGCLKVELNASGSYDPDGVITDYLWYVENGTIDNNTKVICTATFSAGGNYTVRLNVTDDDGLTNTTTREICVSCVPEAVAEVNRTNIAEPGGWVLFDGSNSTCDTTCDTGNSLSYSWNITDDSGCIVNYSASVLRNVTSNTTAVLTVTDEYDCMNSSSVNVTYLHLPVPVINFTATGCLEVELNASGSYDPDGNITGYLWDAENGSIDNNTKVTCTANFSVGGYHTIRLNVTDNDGLTNNTTRMIYVSCVPTAAAEANRTSVTAPGGMVLFDAPNSTCDMTVNNSLNYTWVIHGVTYNDSSGEGVEYYVVNTTTAFLNVTDEYNCTAADNVIVTCQHPPVAEFDFNGTGCKVGILNASESYDPDGNITTYKWDLNDDGVYDNGTGVTCIFGPVPVPPEDYRIGLKVTDDAGVSNITRKQITVTGNPNAVAEANGHNGSLQLPSGGGWVVFSGTNSTAYPGTEIVNASCTWNIPGMSTYYGLGPLPPVFINRDTTATLTVVANNTCTNVSRVEVLMPPIMKEDVPILTPAGMISLISLLCIAGVGRIAKKGRRSHEPSP